MGGGAAEASLAGARAFWLYLASRVLLLAAMQMLSVAVGWHVYETTSRAIDLGYTGLALFLPAALLSIPAGHAADRFDRRTILLACHFANTLCALALTALVLRGVRSVAPIYAVMALLGAVRAFSGPAGQAILPSLVPERLLVRAVAVASSCWQLAMIAGPALGGLLFAVGKGGVAVYATSAAMSAVAFATVLGIAPRPPADTTTGTSWRTLLAGIRYVWSERPILGAISLDLFAVLLGGAVALLPIYARDILHVGPWGLGLLRSAPGIGATAMALALARRPLTRHAGRAMFGAVVLFGVATVVFGTTRTFSVALAALVVLGAADMVSVVVRSSLIQLRTPDAMRGRVSAVNMVFIGASNELGEFESGLTAAWLGPTLAVVAGGVGTIAVALLWMALFPELRRVDRLSD